MSFQQTKLNEVFWFQEGPGVRKWQFTDHGVKLLNVANILKTGQIDLSKTDRYLAVDEVESRYSHFLADEGDLVIASSGISIDNDGLLRTRGATLQPCHLPLCMNTSTIRFKALEGVSDLGFLRHWLQSLEFRSQITREVTGIAQKNFGPSHLKRLKISLPPLSEQKRIAAILDEADALRTKRRESLDELDTLLQSTFLDMFGDPVTNPKGWEVRALAEFYVNKHEGTKCGPFGSALRKGELVRSGVPVWNMDNIDPTGRAKLPFRMWITEDKYEDLRAFSVLPGDVIISRAGTVGKMCVAGPDCPKSVINTNLIRVRFGRQLLPLYFVSLMTYCKGRVGRLKTGPEGAFTHMSTGVLDKLSIPYPPLSVQRRFAAFVQAVEAQKSRYRAQLAELDDLFGSLQQKAFAGELTGNAEVRAGNAEVRAGNAEVRAGNAEVRAGNAERRAGKCQRGSASAERGVWSEERKKVMQSEENMRAVNEKSQEGACGVTDCDTTEDGHGTKPMNE